MPNENSGGASGAALFIHALTPLHPGSGANPGVIDLPIQRERHTRWPSIPASALKGVFRDYCREKVRDGGSAKEADRNQALVNVFGRSLWGDGEEKGGTLSFTDARILALPVRSMFGVYALVTCPAVLSRMQRDLDLTAVSLPADKLPPIALGEALVAKDSVLSDTQRCMVLEEYPFTANPVADEFLATLAALPLCDKTTHSRIKHHLAILSDNDFTYFAENATEVQMRIALDYDTKTVQDGALFSQEFLPAETLMYSLVLSSASRGQNGDGTTAMSSFRKWLGQSGGSILQIGGDETTGKGFCRITMQQLQEGD